MQLESRKLREDMKRIARQARTAGTNIREFQALLKPMEKKWTDLINIRNHVIDLIYH